MRPQPADSAPKPVEQMNIHRWTGLSNPRQNATFACCLKIRQREGGLMPQVSNHGHCASSRWLRAGLPRAHGDDLAANRCRRRLVEH